ncbi:MAG: DUF4974 domain-containing protein [Bacteroidetes bacterium]|nr:DUF4974 domain-containing protein [Bacteroidota bacterium]
MKKGLLHKFLNNRCTSEELREVIDWVKTDALNKDGESINYQEWNKYAGEEFSSDKVRMDSMLDKIHHKINIGQNRMLERTTKSVSMLTWITRVAAVLLLPVLLILSYVISQPFHFANTFAQAKIDFVEVIAPIGSKTVVHLEDGTNVFLNHGSTLKYPQKFIGKSREVQLTGEGYFDVAHNPDKPFLVNVNNIQVKALGTSFNVMAYPDEQVLETTLVEGKVILGQVNAKGKLIHLEEMKPGQNISINLNTNTFKSNFGEVEKYTSWKEGKLIFKNESISQISRRLSRWYNVDIEFTDNLVQNYTYTATFVDETIFQILDLMVLATPICYKTLPREKMTDGTFSKQKITIGLKK